MAATAYHQAPDAAQELQTALRHEAANVRRAALLEIAKLGELGAVSSGCVSKVVELLDDPEATVHEAALNALGAMGKVGAEHVGRIADETAPGQPREVRVAAVQALGELGSDHAAAFAVELEACLEDSDADIVAEACLSLGSIKAAASAPKLVSKLTDSDPMVVAAACGGLGALDAEASAVSKMFSHSEPKVRASAARAMSSMTDASSYSNALAALLADADSYARIAAADALCAVGGQAASVVGAIAPLLAHKEAGVRAAAATSLGGIGPAGLAHAAKLEELLADTSEDTSTRSLTAAAVMQKVSPILRKPACAAATALGAMGSRGSSAILVAALAASGDADMRVGCLGAIGKLGAEGAFSHAEISALTTDPMPTVAAAACLALGALSKDMQKEAVVAAAAAVSACLADPLPAVRAAAAEGVGLMGTPAGLPYLEKLAAALKDGIWSVREAAIRALAGCGEHGQMYAAEVCRLALDPSVPVRVAAIESLTRFGRRGAAFAEDLEPLLEDPVQEVRDAARKALDAFQAAPPGRPPQVPQASPPLAVLNGRADGKEAPLPVGLLFPGQGSQVVGMLKDLKDLPPVRKMLATAEEVLGYDLLRVCLEGPEERLEQTLCCQPAMYVGGLAALEALRQQNPDAVARCQAVAGLSLGEYTALTVAGVFDFETGLRIVKVRAEAMDEAAQRSPQMMVSVAGLERPTLDNICKSSCSGQDDVCQVANALFPKGFALAGTKPAMERCLAAVKEHRDCMQAKALKTSGAFHTALMLPARKKLDVALQEALKSMSPPRCDVYMNVTGAKLSAGTAPSEIVRLLGDQLTGAVLWEASVRAMTADGVADFYECGPQKQLKAMMKRISVEVWKRTTSIEA